MKKSAKETAAKKAPAPAGWRKFAPWIVVAVAGICVIWGLQIGKNKTDFHVEEFSQMPVLLNGRVQPWDSVARNSLLMLRGKSTVLITDSPQGELGSPEKSKLKTMTAMEWLLEAMTRPELADTRYIFRIDNREVLNMLKLPVDRKFFSFNEIRPEFETIRQEARRIGEQRIEEQAQTAREKGALKVNFAVNLYFRIKNSIRPEHTENFTERILSGRELIGPGLAALAKAEKQEEHDTEDLQGIMQLWREYGFLSEVAYPLIIPPKTGKAQKDWANIGTVLKESLRGGELPKPVLAYARMADSYGKSAPEFNQAVEEHRTFLAGSYTPELKKGAQENFFNHYKPFIKSAYVYGVAFLLGCVFWMTWSEWTRKSAVYLLLLAAVVHTSGLIFRMYLEGRPPVTNLYSSAIFVGWGAVVLGLILERVWKNAIGAVAASFVGIVTLIIAYNLSLTGDTMEMLRAVLDTNFWLATHVVMITLGYSAMFIAGLLAILFVVLGLFTRVLDAGVRKALKGMVYGVICFATLFSFVGTILGGIWADQSWGRFWGWDPKENGALLIVIWCAVILHARWGGLIRDRGLMATAIFGNIITSFSWFGVNMLGVGLHSYGFMDKAFWWLAGFCATQVLFICLALIPLKFWRSFSEPEGPKPPPNGIAVPAPSPA